ncbi:RNA polymerase sigma factor [Ruegeria marina]|uniref:RNA polymerase sigma-70 factor, ECF subfamily n=1 Tax=Ruegeria marina TaxID=639004 RepID=A0A1G6UYZ3_9RHOB|nr:RNA polymerase sigma-70 factor, ECF subfamily [Ruegeria marina]
MTYTRKIKDFEHSEPSDASCRKTRHLDEFENELLPELPHLRNYALSLTQDSSEASDLVQDCILKALENRHRFRRGTYMRRWLFRILRNRFLDGWRKKHRRGTHIPIEDCHPSGLSQPGSQEHWMEIRDCERKLSQARPADRMLLLLSVFSALSHKEIANSLGVAEGTVRSRLSRTRAELRP